MTDLLEQKMAEIEEAPAENPDEFKLVGKKGKRKY